MSMREASPKRVSTEVPGVTLELEEHPFEALGVRTRYLQAGEGLPLIMLHGIGETARDWAWVMPTLAQNYRVYALDLPGYGGGSAVKLGYTAEDAAGYVKAFMDAKGIEQAVVLGNSLGGLSVLYLALAAPERVRGLILFDSAGLGAEITPLMLSIVIPGYGELGVTVGQTPAGALQRLGLRLPLLFARPERAPREWHLEQYRAAQRPHFLVTALACARAQLDTQGQRRIVLPSLPQIQQPTLIFWGEKDAIIPLSHAQRAKDGLPNAHLVTLSDCGHLPHVEAPERVLAALEPFLRSL